MNLFLFLLFASCFIGPVKSIAFNKQNRLSSFLTAEFARQTLLLFCNWQMEQCRFDHNIFFCLYIGRSMQEVWPRYLFLMQLLPTAKEMYLAENVLFNTTHVFTLACTPN